MNALNVFILLLLSINSAEAQNVYEVYQDDNMSEYFKVLPSENKFYYSSDNFLDSLKDGVYLLYNVKRTDSLSKYKAVKYKGEYSNGMKQGIFEHINHSYDRKKKRNLQVRVSRCEFAQGRKYGVQEEYTITRKNGQPEISMILFAEFERGKLDGIYMEFLGGYPEVVKQYSQGEVINGFIDNSHKNLKLAD